MSVANLFCDSTIANIVAAINVKASDSKACGVNATVALPILNTPTTFIGIGIHIFSSNTHIKLFTDVYHPPPASKRPSEAALSASINKTATR